ncbi:MAG: porin [Alphaproteobacteria bacterium]
MAFVQVDRLPLPRIFLFVMVKKTFHGLVSLKSKTLTKFFGALWRKNTMKKVLLAGTAIVGAAFFAAPAQAELKLGLGGHFSGYGVYVDEDETGNFDSFAFRRNTEIHFTGETTLDNGLTVGVHVEQEIENAQMNNESYAYFSGGWGRVNFGNEDGAAYLLQVAAPSADSNVDGLRSTIQGFTYDGGSAVTTNTSLDYAHAHFGNGPTDTTVSPTDRITYLTPKFNGFQAGVSYAPRAELATGVVNLSQTNTFEDLWEVAARWDGQFEGVGVSIGAGYSTSDNVAAAGAEPEGWNVGFNLAWNQFSFGAVYLDEEDRYGVQGVDTKTWVVGAAWDNGPWHVGASYLNREDDISGGTSEDSYKATIGGGYAFGPGMTFRGAIAFGEAANSASGNASNEGDFTQVTIGTDIRF